MNLIAQDTEKEITTFRNDYDTKTVTDVLEFIYKIINKKRIRNVLEIGCGDGFWGRKIVEKFKIEVLGLDIDTKAVEKANALAHDMPNFKAITWNVLYKNENFKKYDLVVSFGVLHHFLDPGPVIANITRYTANIVIFEPNRENPILRFSESVRKLIYRSKSIKGVATANETTHPLDVYNNLFSQNRFKLIEKEYINIECDFIKTNSLINILINMKCFLLKVNKFVLSKHPALVSTHITLWFAKNEN